MDLADSILKVSLTFIFHISCKFIINGSVSFFFFFGTTYFSAHHTKENTVSACHTFSNALIGHWVQEVSISRILYYNPTPRHTNFSPNSYSSISYNCLNLLLHQEFQNEIFKKSIVSPFFIKSFLYFLSYLVALKFGAYKKGRINA